MQLSNVARRAGPRPAAEHPAACAAKRTSIEARIADARIHGNRSQLASLNKAGDTDASREADRQRAIVVAIKTVARREADLAAAQAKGNPKKIAKEQLQLDTARADLAQAQKSVLPQSVRLGSGYRRTNLDASRKVEVWNVGLPRRGDQTVVFAVT